MKSIIPAFILMLLFSCNKDDTNLERILPTPILEFVAESNTVSHISDGSSYQDQVVIRLANSDVYFFDESIEFTIRVDEQNSTAIEGVDFNFTSSPYTFTFNSDNNFTQNIPIEILTEEAYTSFTKEITFIAEVIDNSIQTSGIFTINYQCFVDLTGTYTVANDVCGTLLNPFNQNVTITFADNGKWHLDSVDGTFLINCTSYMGPSYGYIEVNCGVVDPSDDIFANSTTYLIGNVLGGSWDQETGVLEMNHSQNFFPWAPTNWNSRYVRL
jgi:hypothetical protein